MLSAVAICTVSCSAKTGKACFIRKGRQQFFLVDFQYYHHNILKCKYTIHFAELRVSAHCPVFKMSSRWFTLHITANELLNVIPVKVFIIKVFYLNEFRCVKSSNK